jgi:hypothetical protein
MRYDFLSVLLAIFFFSAMATAQIDYRPEITYQRFARAPYNSNRVVTATITDDAMLASGSLSPRIVFRKNPTNQYFSNQCVKLYGDVKGGTFECTIDLPLMNAALGDQICFYIIAQDMTGNVVSIPDGTRATDVNTIQTHTATPVVFYLVRGFGGIVEIGPNSAITSLTSSNGLFQQLNEGVITSNVVVNVVGDLNGEMGTHSLRQLVDESGGNASITIQPFGGRRTIIGNAAVTLFRIDGADRVTFNCEPFGIVFKNPPNAVMLSVSRSSQNVSFINCSFE